MFQRIITDICGTLAIADNSLDLRVESSVVRKREETVSSRASRYPSPHNASANGLRASTKPGFGRITESIKTTAEMILPGFWQNVDFGNKRRPKVSCPKNEEIKYEFGRSLL